MKISELIERLKDIQNEYGDIQVNYGKVSKKTLFPLIGSYEIRAINVEFRCEQLKDRILLVPKIVLY